MQSSGSYAFIVTFVWSPRCGKQRRARSRLGMLRRGCSWSLQEVESSSRGPRGPCARHALLMIPIPLLAADVLPVVTTLFCGHRCRLFVVAAIRCYPNTLVLIAKSVA